MNARFAPALLLTATLAACGGGGSSAPPVQNPTQAPQPSSSPAPSSSPSPAATPTATPAPTPAPTTTPAAPLLIHIGFELGEHTDPNFGPVWFYSTNTSQAQVITATHGTQAQFINDDPVRTLHTASGLGTGPFPASFDNVNGFTKQFGTTIDGSLTWSTGSLSFGQKSQVFTVGPPGHYYFGCNYHYTVPPTQNNQSMGDVLVST